MKFLKKLDERPHKNPLPSWGLSLKVLITSLQGFMNNFKDNIHVAQFVTRATIPTHPMKVVISKCVIKRRKFPLMEDDGEMSAEYIDYTPNPNSCTPLQGLGSTSQDQDGGRKIILFAHGNFTS